MIRWMIQEAAALVALALFVSMIAAWSAILAGA